MPGFFPPVIDCPAQGDLAKSGTSDARPVLTETDAGYIYFDATLGRWIGWTGSAWTELDGSPL